MNFLPLNERKQQNNCTKTPFYLRISYKKRIFAANSSLNEGFNKLLLC